MQGRGRFFIILGVVLLAMAIVGGLLIVVLQSRGRGISVTPSEGVPEEGATEVAPQMSDVLVAVQNIGEGQKIQPGMVEVRPVAVTELPPGEPFTQKSDAVGKLATRDIYQKEVLVPEMVIAVEDVQRLGGPAASLFPEGRVAVAFPVDQLSSVNYAIQTGDRVDVLISGAFIDVDPDTQIKLPLVFEGGEDCQPGCQIVGDQVQRTFSQLTIWDAEVLGIGTWGPQPTPTPAEGTEGAEGEGEAAAAEVQPSVGFTSVILVVSDQDAVVLKYLRENGYVIDLALRSRDDMSPHEPEQVTLEYIMTRFRISPPTKLPYRLDTLEVETAIPTPPPAPAE